MIIKIIVMYPIQHNEYRIGIDNSLVLLIGGIPIVVLIALSATMAIDSPPQRKRRRATSERLKVKNQATEANGSPSASTTATSDHSIEKEQPECNSNKS